MPLTSTEPSAITAPLVLASKPVMLTVEPPATICAEPIETPAAENEPPLSVTSNVPRRVHENATAKLDAARDRLQADLAAGRITQALWLEQIVPPQDAWSREIEAAADRLVASRPSAFIQIAGYFLLHGPPVLFLLHLVLLAVWWSVARRLLIDLHSRGYNWLGLPDALCMIIALRGKSWSAPPAHDYLLIPGHSEETGALIAFLKARGRRG